MTNKEFRSGLARETRDKYNERNRLLEQAEKSSFSEWLKDQMKKEIMENFYKEMDEMKSKPWYEEARKTHLEEIKTRIWLNEAKKEKERLQKEYEKKLAEMDSNIADKNKSYKEAQIAHRWKVEAMSENDAENIWKLSQEKIEKLYWNQEAILKDLKENHVKIEENQEMLWYKWKKVHIELPAVWNFQWFKFEYFVSNDGIRKANFEQNADLESKSYSAKDLSNLLTAMNQYMKEMWVETDGDNADYSANGSLIGYGWGYDCEAWECLKTITWLNYYWLRDKDVAWKQGSRARWNCYSDRCNFYRNYNDNDSANLFLRLSA